jgi:hypothetical protein
MKPQWEERMSAKDILASFSTLVKIDTPSVFFTMLEMNEESEKESMETSPY